MSNNQISLKTLFLFKNNVIRPKIEKMYNPDKWKDYGDYYVYEDETKGIGYLQTKKFRVTGFRINSCIGGSGTKPFKTKDQIALEIVGLKVEAETDEAKARMLYGSLHEAGIRDWYTQSINYQGTRSENQSGGQQYIVKELEFAIPKFDVRLGAASDGGVYHVNDPGKLIGILEIKCPQKFYQSLDDYVKLGYNQTNDYLHIYRSHYDQMQMEMAIYNVEWCDYLVYCIPENRVFLEKVPRNRDYWNNMYIKTLDFIEGRLQALLDNLTINPQRYPWNPKNPLSDPVDLSNTKGLKGPNV